MYKAIYGLPGLYLGGVTGFFLTLVVPIDMRLAFAIIMGVPIGALSIGIPLINVGARKDRARPRRWGYESAFRVGVCVFLGLYLGPLLIDRGGMFTESIMLGGFFGACGGFVWSFVAFRLKRPRHRTYETIFRVGVGVGVGFLVSPVLYFLLFFIPFTRSLMQSYSPTEGITSAYSLTEALTLGCGVGAVIGALWPYLSAQIKRIKRQDTGTTAV